MVPRMSPIISDVSGFSRCRSARLVHAEVAGTVELWQVARIRDRGKPLACIESEYGDADTGNPGNLLADLLHRDEAAPSSNSKFDHRHCRVLQRARQSRRQNDSPRVLRAYRTSWVFPEEALNEAI